MAFIVKKILQGKKKSSKSDKDKLERALREEKQEPYFELEKTEAEKKFEETKRQRVKKHENICLC